jgi:hypothetical protein
MLYGMSHGYSFGRINDVECDSNALVLVRSQRIVIFLSPSNLSVCC